MIVFDCSRLYPFEYNGLQPHTSFLLIFSHILRVEGNTVVYLTVTFCQGYFLPNLLLFSFAIQPKADDAFYAKVKSAFLADDNMWSVYYEWFCLRVTESHPRKHRQGYLM